MQILTVRAKLKRVTALLPKQDWTVVGWVLGIKILLFYIAIESYAVIWSSWLGSPHRWFEIWDQWDFGYYQEIAEFGYSAGDGYLMFCPLFAWVICVVS